MIALPDSPPIARDARRGVNPWPLGIVLAYGSFAAAMIGFAVWSTGHGEQLVSRDYYARAAAHPAKVEAVARARSLPVVLTATSATSLRLRNPPGLAGAAQGVTVRLYRPSEAALDRELRAAFDATGASEIPLHPPLAPGFWRASTGWTLDGREYLVETTLRIGP